MMMLKTAIIIKQIMAVGTMKMLIEMQNIY